jgi:ribonucleoside-triphosphate reductase
MAEKFLTDAGVAYEKIYADQNPDLAKQFEIKQAPTLVIVNGDNIEKVMNVSNIRKFAEGLKK